MVKFKIIVDGSNGAFLRRNIQKKAKIKNIILIMKYLQKLKEKYSIDYEIITDANLKYNIDQKSRLEKFYKVGSVIECPSKRKADDFIIEYYRRHPEDTIILSNDNFSEYRDVNPVVLKIVIMFNELIIKPDLIEFLEIKNNLKEKNEINALAI